MGRNTSGAAERAHLGIGHRFLCGNPKPKSSWDPWQTLDATRSATASENVVFDVVIKGCGRLAEW